MDFTRESIFISALRSFVKSFAVILGISFSLILVLLVIGLMSNSICQPKKSEMVVSSDANWSRKSLSNTAPVIVRLNVEGVIGAMKLKTDKFKNLLLDSREGALANNRVKGIILYMNSPGGSATVSESIYILLKQYKERYKVPIYVFVDGLCASGGMYISCAADQIFATSSSVIGSVGVRLGPAFNVSEAMNKVGIGSVTLTDGKNKDALNPFRPWKENEEASLKTIVEDEYQEFVDVVAAARPRLSKEKLINEYGANVFSAKTAQEYGYIDETDATYDQALKALVKAAGIKEEEKYQVVEIEPYQSVLSDLAENRFGFLKGKIEHVFPALENIPSELQGQVLYLYQP